MKIWIAMTLVAMSASPLFATGSLEEQENCLDNAMSRYGAARAAVTAQMQKDLQPCNARGSDEFADRCYLIAARRFETASRIAENIYKAEKSACLH